MFTKLLKVFWKFVKGLLYFLHIFSVRLILCQDLKYLWNCEKKVSCEEREKTSLAVFLTHCKLDQLHLTTHSSSDTKLSKISPAFFMPINHWFCTCHSLCTRLLMSVNPSIFSVFPSDIQSLPANSMAGHCLYL